MYECYTIAVVMCDSGSKDESRVPRHRAAPAPGTRRGFSGGKTPGGCRDEQ